MAKVRMQGGVTTLTRRYYAFAGQTIAMEDGSGLEYFLTDHLGSVVAVLNSSGALLSEQRYLPFGQVRSDVGNITQTDFGYTSQRDNSYINLLDYRSRWYDAALGRFIQPDTIVPNPADTQAFNRYSHATLNGVLTTRCKSPLARADVAVPRVGFGPTTKGL